MHLQGLNDPLNLCSSDGCIAGIACISAYLYPSPHCCKCSEHIVDCQGNQTGRLLEFVRAKQAAGGCLEERQEQPIVMNGFLDAETTRIVASCDVSCSKLVRQCIMSLDRQGIIDAAWSQFALRSLACLQPNVFQIGFVQAPTSTTTAANASS